MKSQIHDAQSGHNQFPLSALPQSVRTLCACLAAPDHPEAAAMAALAILGGAMGPAAHVLVPETREPISGRLLLLIQSAQGQVGCLTALLAPMLDAQRRALAEARTGADAEALCRQESQLRAARRQWVATERFPEKTHLEHFDRQLRQINLKRSQLFHVENPLPGSIPDAFTLSPDQAVFAAWTHADSFSRTVKSWETEKGKRERNFISKALVEETFFEAVADGGLIFERPCLSGIAVSSRECLMELTASDSPFLPGREPIFVIEDGSPSGALAASSNAEKALTSWAKRVSELLSARFEREARRYSISPGAGSVLATARAREFGQLETMCDFSPRSVVALCIRLTLLLHVWQDDPPESIPESVAQCAIRLARWLVAEDYRIVAGVREAWFEERRRIDRDKMVQIIRDKGPLRWAELFRSYDVNDRRFLRQTLNDLQQTGEVVQGSDKLLRVCAKAQKPANFSLGAIANCSAESIDNTNNPTSDG